LNLDKLFSIASMIVVVALVTTIVTRPNSARVFRSIGSAASEFLGTAMGEGLVKAQRRK
jgi:VIT1/CCC1 family predicted Fe2+/Mn2+ transporter